MSLDPCSWDVTVPGTSLVDQLQQNSTQGGEQQEMGTRRTRGGKKDYIEETLLELNLGV